MDEEEEVSGRSMQPTLNPFSPSPFSNDRVLADRWAARRGLAPARGDVVVLRAPDAPITLVKRVTAVEGDLIRVPSSGRVLTIPRGHCWVEGDNAGCSRDSRSEYGPVSTSLITGRVACVVWPPWRLGAVEHGERGLRSACAGGSLVVRRSPPAR